MEVNLDVITEKPLKVTLHKQVYEVVPLKLGPYLNTQKLQDDFAKAKSVKAQVDTSINLIRAFAPVIPDSALRDATPGQLTKLMLVLGEFQSSPGEDDSGNAGSAAGQ
jgi:hypothetical protein